MQVRKYKYLEYMFVICTSSFLLKREKHAFGATVSAFPDILKKDPSLRMWASGSSTVPFFEGSPLFSERLALYFSEQTCLSGRAVSTPGRTDGQEKGAHRSRPQYSGHYLSHAQGKGLSRACFGERERAAARRHALRSLIPGYSAGLSSRRV